MFDFTKVLAFPWIRITAGLLVIAFLGLLIFDWRQRNQQLAELRQDLRMLDEYGRVWTDLRYGRIQPGDDIEAVIELTRPSRIERYGAFSDLYYGALGGFGILVIKGKQSKVVEAFQSGCNFEHNHTFFDQMTLEDRELARKSFVEQQRLDKARFETLVANPMGKTLGFNRNWFGLGLVDQAFLDQAAKKWQSGEDPNTEHYRYHAFQNFLAQHPILSEDLATALYALGDADPDQAMGGAMMFDILRRPEAPASIRIAAIVSGRQHLVKTAEDLQRTSNAP